LGVGRGTIQAPACAECRKNTDTDPFVLSSERIATSGTPVGGCEWIAFVKKRVAGGLASTKARRGNDLSVNGGKGLTLGKGGPRAEGIETMVGAREKTGIHFAGLSKRGWRENGTMCQNRNGERGNPPCWGMPQRE